MPKKKPRPQGPIIAECATWLSIVSQLFSTRMNALLRPHGLTLGQLSILEHIMQPRLTGQNRVGDIASAVEVGQPAVTKTLKKFEQMGLVEMIEDADDRRSKSVRALPEAHRLRGEIYQSMGPDLMKLFASLGEENMSPFAEQLKILGKYLDENRLPPAEKG